MKKILFFIIGLIAWLCSFMVCIVIIGFIFGQIPSEPTKSILYSISTIISIFVGVKLYSDLKYKFLLNIPMEDKTKNFWFSTIIILILAIIYTLFIPKNEEKYNNVDQKYFSKEDIKVVVTREPARNLTEKDLKDVKIIKIIEEKLLDKLKKRMKEAYRARGGNKNIEPEINRDSWGVTKRNKNFVIVKFSIENVAQSTSIIGIKENVLIKISGMKRGSSPVPHSYGPCAKKMEEIFGFSLNAFD